MLEDLGPALLELRREAEVRMTDTCAVTYQTGTTTQNETTGEQAPVYATRFTSACRVTVRRPTGEFDTTDAGGTQEAHLQPEVHLPVSANRVYEDDLVTITAVGPFTDPQLLGRVFRVLAGNVKSHATARRIPVREV